MKILMGRIGSGIDWTAEELSQAGSCDVERGKWPSSLDEGMERLSVQRRRTVEGRGDEKLAMCPLHVPKPKKETGASRDGLLQPGFLWDGEYAAPIIRRGLKQVCHFGQLQAVRDKHDLLASMPTMGRIIQSVDNSATPPI